MDDNKGETVMAVQMICPNLRCRKILAVPDEVRGKLVKCQFCQQPFRVPAPKGVAAGSGSQAPAQPNK